MKQSELFSKTSKTSQGDATSINHDLLTRAGYIDQLMAGVYSYLPLGVRVIENISRIVREEMNAIGGQEVSLPALQPKSNWEQTGRWEAMDVLFKVDSQTKTQYALGPTHEEVIVPLAKKFINSYRDLPRAWYQIQVKFRDELRAKAGLLRGREFLMKDLYSFHTSADDLKTYYKKAQDAYMRVFARCGLNAICTEASGGSFTKDFSHEYQVETPSGEDTIFTCECGFAQNKEIFNSPPAKGEMTEGQRGLHNQGEDITSPNPFLNQVQDRLLAGGESACSNCGKAIIERKTIEVGNIFDLGTKFSKDFDVQFTNEKGEREYAVIGCYGIGISRLMGAIVEVHHDERGIIWPKEVAPYAYHLLTLSDDADVKKQSQTVYDALIASGKRVLWDEREGATNGEKLGDADLLGMPTRLLVSPKTEGKIEVKERSEKETKLMELSEILK